VWEVEEQCTGLVRRECVLHTQGASEWPDGTVTTRYRFVHALYQDVLYERVPVAQRVRYYQRIGERAEQGYGERAGEIAAELARHFEQGRDFRRAVHYLLQGQRTASGSMRIASLSVWGSLS
jgi:predicted ATPase